MGQTNTQRELIKAQKEQEARKRTRNLLIGGLVLVVAVLLVYFLPRLLNTSQVQGYANQDGRSVGDPNAPVTVV